MEIVWLAWSDFPLFVMFPCPPWSLIILLINQQIISCVLCGLVWGSEESPFVLRLNFPWMRQITYIHIHMVHSCAGKKLWNWTDRWQKIKFWVKEQVGAFIQSIRRVQWMVWWVWKWCKSYAIIQSPPCCRPRGDFGVPVVIIKSSNEGRSFERMVFIPPLPETWIIYSDECWSFVRGSWCCLLFFSFLTHLKDGMLKNCTAFTICC